MQRHAAGALAARDETEFRAGLLEAAPVGVRYCVAVISTDAQDQVIPNGAVLDLGVTYSSSFTVDTTFGADGLASD